MVTVDNARYLVWNLQAHDLVIPDGIPSIDFN